MYEYGDDVRCWNLEGKYGTYGSSKKKKKKNNKTLLSNLCRKFKKKKWYFHISAQNIDCEYSLEPHWRDGSYESMFLSRNKKNSVYPCKTPVLLYKSGV